MRLTEAKVVKLIQEAYDKRLSYYLTEKMDVKNMGSLDDADMLKVRNSKTGYEYTFGGVIEGGLIKLYLPDESRISPDKMRQKRFMPEVDIDDMSEPAGESDIDDRDFIAIDEKTFEEEYELA